MTDFTELPLDRDDFRLLSAVASAATSFDPPPNDLVTRIMLAVSLDLMEAELATLVAAPMAMARTEHPLAPETITFTSSAASLMIALDGDNGDVRVDGWVTGGTQVELHTGREVLPQTADETGRLVWQAVPRGPVRFLIRPLLAGASPVITPTIEL
ncbi:hypothetical protein SAMN02745244_02723 [Tessaracoccus bendigoensis DSM 12906]|uniref:Uncharacterized protein n=1 Tax=Tessaracoccus bendigoensis DSM 12906 TaxID=1123357 RepID=A0A1M6K3G8_9ACTN|nr:hypothetical protein [Tessaracoccus bendigoensis]SHJ53470.1 hypothetical protein SAMN02745244_02723 [Tessaracoccus bendigoensis DSM 12906]